MSFMEQNNIELPMHDIVADDAARERLIEVGGKRQVPCLFIDGKAMYESGDIINYLSEAFHVSDAHDSDDDDAAAAAACTIGGACSF